MKESLKEKIKIHQFDPIIYPFKLWVVVGASIDTLKEHFCNLDNTELTYILVGTENAFVDYVINKSNSYIGAVINFETEEQLTIKNIAHESCHAAKYLFEHIGADVRPHEPFEYVVGWIADCCEQVKLNKFKE